jgi:predicted P-loop ATPase
MKVMMVILAIISGAIFFQIFKNTLIIDLIIKDRKQMIELNQLNINLAKDLYAKNEEKEEIIKRMEFELESAKNQKFNDLSRKEIKKLIKERNKKFGIGGNL